MAVMDWLPCQGYNDGAQVPPGGVASLELMSDSLWIDPTVVGEIELQKKFKILRIVGYWTVRATSEAAQTGSFWVRVWPAFKEPAGGSVSIPGILGAALNPAAAGPANQKWWWERVVPSVDVERPSAPWERANNFAHPYSYMADFKPDMWLEGQQTPVATLESDLDVSVDFIHRWRMLAIAP